MSCRCDARSRGRGGGERTRARRRSGTGCRRKALSGLRGRGDPRRRRRQPCHQARRDRRAARPQRLRQELAADARRGADGPGCGRRPLRRARSRHLLPGRSRGLPAPPDRLRLPVVPPDGWCARGGERGDQAARRSHSIAPGAPRGDRVARARRSRGAAQPHSRQALRRRAPTRGDRACARQRAAADPRRRADGQPRQQARWRDLALLAELAREQHAAVLLVTHDPQAAAVADQVCTLRDGKLAVDRPTLAPSQSPRRRAWG